MQLTLRALLCCAASLLLFGGCTSTPQSKASGELKREIARRQSETPSQPVRLSPQEKMQITGENERLSKWEDRIASEASQRELERETARRMIAIEVEQSLQALTETINEQEARQATRIRLGELHRRLVAREVASSRASAAGIPGFGVENATETARAVKSLDPAQVLAEIERLSRIEAASYSARKRALEQERCRRALKAMLELEEASRD